MKKLMALAGLALAAASCSDAAQPLAYEPAEPRLAVWGVDNDYDGIDDGTESELADRFAPVLYMPNLITRAEAGGGVAGDWTWPAGVPWYLANTQLRFHHENCPDHQVLSLGTITTSNLVTQQHQRATSWLGCSHSGTTYGSGGSGGWSAENHFFVQAVNDDVTHPGVRDPAQWPVYVHAYPNTLGGINIQYWFFYAYNDFVASFNHEGDWEHLTVRLDANQQVNALFYGQHNGEALLYPYQVTWHGGTHPQVWVGDGSHASYPSEGQCDATVNEGWNQSCWTNLAQRWFTWSGGRGTDAGLQGAGLVNVGEMPQANTLKRPMPGQEWIKYSGRWGELGVTPYTNGPRSPGYQAFWTTN